MMNQVRMLMGGVAAIGVLAATAWICFPRHGSVEIKQLDPASWSVQITELGTVADNNKTASATR